MICPSCGAAAEADWKFCMRCGASLAESAPPVFPPAGAPPPTGPAAVETFVPAPRAPEGARAAAAREVLPFAGFWVRFVAYWIDWIILAFAVWLLYLIAGVAAVAPGLDFGAIDPMDPTADVGALLGGMQEYAAAFGQRMLAQSALTWAYMTLFTGVFGQTPGKMAMRVKVVTAHGEVPGLGRAALREIPGKFLSSLVFLLGYLWAAFDPRKQAWHDKIAGTYVVRTRAEEPGLAIPAR